MDEKNPGPDFPLHVMYALVKDPTKVYSHLYCTMNMILSQYVYDFELEDLLVPFSE